jgi:hypothetical protein
MGSVVPVLRSLDEREWEVLQKPHNFTGDRSRLMGMWELIKDCEDGVCGDGLNIFPSRLYR